MSWCAFGFKCSMFKIWRWIAVVKYEFKLFKCYKCVEKYGVADVTCKKVCFQYVLYVCFG